MISRLKELDFVTKKHRKAELCWSYCNNSGNESYSREFASIFVMDVSLAATRQKHDDDT